MPKVLLLIGFIFFSVTVLFGQEVELGVSKPNPASHDTSYIQVFPGYATTRLYLSQKITNLEFFDDALGAKLTYDPNTTLNLGVGATIKGFTLNLAYGFDFLNPEEGKGRTRYLDLQSHVYGRNSVIDFYGQFYNGLYLNNTAEQMPDWDEPFYVRPDMRLRLFGFSFLHLFNGEKFSYAAPFVHNEVQKKSAGSFTLGGEFTLVYADGDSTLISPLVMDTLFSPLRGLTEVAFFDIGPKGGYSHSFIFFKHMFLTLSLSVGIGLGPTRYTYADGTIENEWLINPSATARFGFGYNSPDWYLGLTFVQSTFQNAEFETMNGMTFGVGNIRLNYVKRFLMGPKLTRLVDKLPL
ncbi:MAG: DUF4421 domain-containing protein [Bacteroidota bacterium]